MGSWGSVPGGVKLQGHDADHSPPSSGEVKNDGAIHPLPHIASRQCLDMLLSTGITTFYFRGRWQGANMVHLANPHFLLHRPFWILLNPDFLLRRPLWNWLNPDFLVHQPFWSWLNPDFLVHRHFWSWLNSDFLVHRPFWSRLNPDFLVHRPLWSWFSGLLKFIYFRLPSLSLKC
jgi:hypothetical protein